MPFDIRPANLSDKDKLDTVYMRSYSQLMSAAYDAKLLELALPRITKANPELLTGDRFLWPKPMMDP